MKKIVLGRCYNINTDCWEKPGAVAIPNIQMNEVLKHGATLLDLLVLLIWRDSRRDLTLL